MRILIMGLPGSGKTTFAESLQKKLNCPWFNADRVREQFNDWDFSEEGRIRQAHRMRSLCDGLPNQDTNMIIDMVCPLPEMRNIIDPDFVVWMDTIDEGRFEDTNKVFVKPIRYGYRVCSFDGIEYFSNLLVYVLQNNTKISGIINNRNSQGVIHGNHIEYLH